MKPIYISSIAILLLAPQLIFAADWDLKIHRELAERFNGQSSVLPANEMEKMLLDAAIQRMAQSRVNQSGNTISLEDAKAQLNAQRPALLKEMRLEITKIGAANNLPTPAQPTTQPNVSGKPLYFNPDSVDMLAARRGAAGPIDPKYVDVIKHNGLKLVTINLPNTTPVIARLEITDPNFNPETFAKYQSKWGKPLETSVRPIVNENMSMEAAWKLVKAATATPPAKPLTPKPGIFSRIAGLFTPKLPPAVTKPNAGGTMGGALGQGAMIMVPIVAKDVITPFLTPAEEYIANLLKRKSDIIARMNAITTETQNDDYSHVSEKNMLREELKSVEKMIQNYYDRVDAAANGII